MQLTDFFTRAPSRRLVGALAALALLATACGSDEEPAATTEAPVATEPEPVTVGADPVTTDEPVVATDPATADDPVTDEEPQSADHSSDDAAETRSFVAEVWADNWFALYVDGVLVGEDSVPITTERSFNAEKIAFDESYPFTLGVEAKDFKETDSGLEYIGAGNQQMGDGGLIVQITDVETGEVVAVSDATWSALVVHRAPLNTECESSANPDADCEFEVSETPTDWTDPAFDDTSWSAATVWSESAVSPKDGYDEIAWVDGAKLVWGSDLEVDNTILFRATVAG